MTRRAFRPNSAAGAGVAPVISNAEGFPCGAFGSTTVLISNAFPALVGGARRLQKLSPERGRRSTRAVVFCLECCGLPEGEKSLTAAAPVAWPAARSQSRLKRRAE